MGRAEGEETDGERHPERPEKDAETACVLPVPTRVGIGRGREILAEFCETRQSASSPLRPITLGAQTAAVGAGHVGGGDLSEALESAADRGELGEVEHPAGALDVDLP